MTGVFLWQNKQERIFNSLTRSWRLLAPVGIFNAVQMIAYVVAMQGGLAVYVLSLKRTSVLIVVILSALLYGERRIVERFFAALVMLIGVLCISLEALP